jgi:homoserine kinase
MTEDAMIKVTTPATTANLGPGFDSIGMALSVTNTLCAEESDSLSIEVRMPQVPPIPTDEDNLIYKTIKGFYDELGFSFPGVHMIQEDNIPLTRGLGSSAACVVSGLLAANALSGAGLSKEDLLQMAARLEGHPDNAAPAMLGGIVVGAMRGQRLYCSRLDAPGLDRLNFALLIPDFPLPTEKARNVLPSSYSREDAVFNASRAALLVAALAQGEHDLLECAFEDRFHQPYRSALIPNMAEIFSECKRAGALATFLSGAGPTLISVTKDLRFCPSLPSGWKLQFVAPSAEGAVCENITL